MYDRYHSISRTKTHAEWTKRPINAHSISSGLLWRSYFPVNFAKILRTLFSVNTFGGYFFQISPNLKRRRTGDTQFKNELKTKQNTNSNLSAASRCILVLFKWYGHPKKKRPKSSCNLYLYIFHVKTKWNIVYKYLKTKIFSRDTNILWTLSYSHWGFWVSLNYPILNFKKMVCPKNIWMRYWIYSNYS